MFILITWLCLIPVTYLVLRALDAGSDLLPNNLDHTTLIVWSFVWPMIFSVLLIQICVGKPLRRLGDHVEKLVKRKNLNRTILDIRKMNISRKRKRDLISFEIFRYRHS